MTGPAPHQIATLGASGSLEWSEQLVGDVDLARSSLTYDDRSHLYVAGERPEGGSHTLVRQLAPDGASLETVDMKALAAGLTALHWDSMAGVVLGGTIIDTDPTYRRPWVGYLDANLALRAEIRDLPSYSYDDTGISHIATSASGSAYALAEWTGLGSKQELVGLTPDAEELWRIEVGAFADLVGGPWVQDIAGLPNDGVVLVGTRGDGAGSFVERLNADGVSVWDRESGGTAVSVVDSRAIVTAGDDDGTLLLQHLSFSGEAACSLAARLSPTGGTTVYDTEAVPGRSTGYRA